MLLLIVVKKPLMIKEEEVGLKTWFINRSSAKVNHTNILMYLNNEFEYLIR